MRRGFFAVTVAMLLVSGCIIQQPLPPAPEPSPGPSKIDKAARKAMQDYAAGLANSFREASQQEFETADAANKWVAARNKQAREEAFRPFDAILDDAIGGEKWGAEEASKLFGDVSTSFGKVAK